MIGNVRITREGYDPANPTSDPTLDGCNCWNKAPTVPVYRDRMNHLADCPAKDSGNPVGSITLPTPLTTQDREAILFALHAEPPMPSGPTALAIDRYEATVRALEARCEAVATDLCTYVAMQGTSMELESFLFRTADKLRGATT